MSRFANGTRLKVLSVLAEDDQTFVGRTGKVCNYDKKALLGQRYKLSFRNGEEYWVIKVERAKPLKSEQ